MRVCIDLDDPGVWEVASAREVDEEDLAAEAVRLLLDRHGDELLVLARSAKANPASYPLFNRLQLAGAVLMADVVSLVPGGIILALLEGAMTLVGGPSLLALLPGLAPGLAALALGRAALPSLYEVAGHNYSVRRRHES